MLHMWSLSGAMVPIGFNLLFLSFALSVRGATHELIVGTFVFKALYALSFDDAIKANLP